MMYFYYGALGTVLFLVACIAVMLCHETNDLKWSSFNVALLRWSTYALFTVIIVYVLCQAIIT